MRAADTSLIIAAFASWHEKHERARHVLDGGMRLIDHCALETYSVLTRLPAPHRAPGDVVRDFLKRRFPRPFVRLSARRYREFVLSLPERGIFGGSSYDAFVAATAHEHGLVLVSADKRAAATYERCGVRFELI